MATGVIESVEDKGKNVRLKVGGRWYSSPLKELLGYQGQEIIFEPAESQYNGKTYYWINAYQLSSADTRGIGVPQNPGQVATAAPIYNQGASTVPQPPGTPPKPQTTDASQLLPMTSNIVAHAIQAGRIQEPGQIDAWAAAAFHAASKCASGRYNEFDDDIPF